MERKIKRGDIYYADLNPVVGSEQGGTRPVLIISNDMGNKYSPTVIAAAITSRAYSKVRLPTHTQVTDFEGLDKESVVLLEQIRTLDKKRLIKYMGLMPGNVMARVDKALAISISLRICPEGKCKKTENSLIEHWNKTKCTSIIKAYSRFFDGGI